VGLEWTLKLLTYLSSTRNSDSPLLYKYGGVDLPPGEYLLEDFVIFFKLKKSK
jgi:hypothetical protein